VLSSIVTFEVQRRVLENLRPMLVYANRDMAEMGRFDVGTNQLKFVFVPDLPINTTALTEGAPPTARALSITPATVSTTQYGDLVSITDVAKVVSPIALVETASERVSRQAADSMDQIVRDVIAAGGTAFYANAVANRAALAAGDKLDSADLRRLRSKMYKSNISPFADGFYRIIVTAEQGYDLRNDGTTAGNWVEANKYARPETLLKGELGRLEGFRILEATNGPTFASTVTVHAAIAVGAQKGWGWGDLQTLSVHHIPAGGDHKDPLAQEELLGWKVMFGVGVLDNARYFRVESSASTL
jgi:N4-gp56 family major capsid protein